MRLKLHISLGENAHMALATLRENKIRSFLTVLGVVIGITALLSVVAVLVGVYADVNSFLSDFGAETFFIFKFDPGIHTSGRLSAEELLRKPLSAADAEAIAEQCPDIKAVAPVVVQRPSPNGQPQQIITARYKGKEVAGVDYHGVVPEDELVFNSHAAEGRHITHADNLHRSDVALIGPDLAQALFGDEEALGKSILVDGVNYEVVGVMARRKGQLVKDQTVERAILVPYRTYQKHRPADDENLIGAIAYPGRMAEAKDEIRAVLRRRRHVAYDKPDNFGVSSAKEIADQFRQITASVALLISVISSVGLLVGGVGVMNIMLMSVTQRTREIGVRKAIGARRRDVVWQFLTEAVVLTGAGGVIGVILGLIISFLIHAFVPKLPSAVPLWSIVLAVTVSMSVGLFFGIYPAVKASRLDPVEALRYE